jgi:hypothetical protein
MAHLVEDALLAAQTEKAVLIVSPSDTERDDREDGLTQWWVPRSVIEQMDMEEVGDVGEMEVRTWFANKEGMPGT